MEVNQVEDLTEKELSILKMFSSGMLREDVASKLSISPKTLRFYLFKIYQKLGVTKLHQCVVWYLIKHYDLVEKAGC